MRPVGFVLVCGFETVDVGECSCLIKWVVERGGGEGGLSKGRLNGVAGSTNAFVCGFENGE
jgi:hypothetical protein